jgi:predicted outer membrane repeat protein
MRRRLGASIFLVLLVVGMGKRPLYAADSVVGTGTPASCTEAAFNTALAAVQASSGGTITFNCGGAVTIAFTSGKIISNANVTINGGNNLTLSGVNAVRHFYVESNAHLTLQNITLTNGFDNTFGGGSILSLGELTLNNATIRDSNVDSGHSGGAIMAYNPVGISNSLIENNAGGSVGGLFLFGEAADATITGSTFRNNRAINPNYGLGGAITTWDGADLIVRSSTLAQNQAINGGAIYNESANTTILLEQNSILDNNSVTGDGGGLYNVAGTATLSQVTVSNNSATDGGGIYNDGTATLTGVTLIGNYGNSHGGGIANWENVSIINSTLSNNIAFLGGGLFTLDGTATLTQVTLSSNSASSGGGIKTLDRGVVSLTHVTLSNNSGGAIAHDRYASSFTLKNVILNQGAQGGNCNLGKPLISNGFNLSSDNSCGLNQAGDQHNVDPRLGPLADNGGPTRTHILLPGSPAIDAGQCVPGLTTDQRGLPRLQGLACDVGAVERQPVDVAGFLIYLPMVIR